MIDNYVDPLVGSDRARRFAVMAPVLLWWGRGQVRESDWIVLVVECQEETLKPLKELEKKILWYSFGTLSLVMIVISGPWAFVLMGLRQGRTSRRLGAGGGGGACRPSGPPPARRRAQCPPCRGRLPSRPARPPQARRPPHPQARRPPGPRSGTHPAAADWRGVLLGRPAPPATQARDARFRSGGTAAVPPQEAESWPNSSHRGSSPTSAWKRTLPEGDPFVLGRESQGWDVPGNARCRGSTPSSPGGTAACTSASSRQPRNPIFHRGDEAKTCVSDQASRSSSAEPASLWKPRAPPIRPIPGPCSSRGPSARRSSSDPVRDAPHRIEVLRGLTDVIASAADDNELFAHLVSLLLAGIRRADAIALVAADHDVHETAAVRVLDAECRLPGAGEFRPSQRLVREAVLRLRDSVVHVWAADLAEGEQRFTLGGNFDWAFCTSAPGEVCRGWGIYAAGRLSAQWTDGLLATWDQNDLGEELKFAELVASILSSLRQLQVLQHRQSFLSHFFSPKVLRVIGGADRSTAEAEGD